MSTNKTIYKVIRIAFTVMVILLVVSGTMRASMVAYDFGYRVFTESPMDEAPGISVLVTVQPGMDGKEVGELLYKKGLVRDANLFWLQYELSAYAGELIPGNYTLNTSMDAKEMMIIMADQEEETEE